MSTAVPKTSVAAVALPPDVVKNQLERILGSSHFADSPRLKRFLQYVVDECLAGNDDRLKGYTIALEVFDRPDDFDPQTDTIVRVQAGQMRRRLDLYYADEGRDDPLRIAVPKGTYAPIFQVMLDPDAPEPSDQAPRAALQSESSRPSIAVLPFANFSGDPNDQYFADGLTEETIANLTRFKDLFVFSRSTTSKLAHDGADIRQLREELGVDFVLEGSVRKSSDAVRVTAQLIDAATDGHIFAESFDRPCTPAGVFEIQDEIALLVASRVADRYGPLGRYVARATRAGQAKRWETYSWMTQFYVYYATHDPARHLEVRKGLTEALEQDPESSDGSAALAAVLLDEYRFHFNERPSYPALERALEHASHAVSCDPENAFAYQMLAITNFHRREFTEFRVVAERALELNPGHADMLADIGHCYVLLGDWNRGLPLLERAIMLSPVHPGWYHFARAIHHALKGDAQLAVIEMKKVPMPGFFWCHALLACFFADLGDEKAVAAEVSELLVLYPEFGENAHDELHIWCIDGAMAEYLISGWRKAGLKIK